MLLEDNLYILTLIDTHTWHCGQQVYYLLSDLVMCVGTYNN